jgi:hypothetical protein
VYRKRITKVIGTCLLPFSGLAIWGAFALFFSLVSILMTSSAIVLVYIIWCMAYVFLGGLFRIGSSDQGGKLFFLLLGLVVWGYSWQFSSFVPLSLFSQAQGVDYIAGLQQELYFLELGIIFLIAGFYLCKFLPQSLANERRKKNITYVLFALQIIGVTCAVLAFLGFPKQITRSFYQPFRYVSAKFESEIETYHKNLKKEHQIDSYRVGTVYNLRKAAARASSLFPGQPLIIGDFSIFYDRYAEVWLVINQSIDTSLEKSRFLVQTNGEVLALW